MLRELELKKPQLEELLQTAENLKSETNRHNLHGKGIGDAYKLTNVSYMVIWFIISLID